MFLYSSRQQFKSSGQLAALLDILESEAEETPVYTTYVLNQVVDPRVRHRFHTSANYLHRGPFPVFSLKTASQVASRVPNYILQKKWVW